MSQILKQLRQDTSCLQNNFPERQENLVDLDGREYPFVQGNIIPRTLSLSTLISDVCRLIERFEEVHQLRKRRRKVSDLRSFRLIVERIVCEVLKRSLELPGGSLAIGLGKRHKVTRYTSPVVNKKTSHILNCMASPELSLLEVSPGNHWERRSTTIKAGPRLIDKLKGMSVDSIGYDTQEEIIVLKSAKDPVEFRCSNERIDYNDTQVTNSLRTEVREINEWISTFDFWIPEGGPEGLLKLHVQRYFNNGSFDQGGRLFGGFWQTMGKSLRRRLEINDEPVVVLDFDQMAPSLLYAHVNVAGGLRADAYSIPEYQEHRAGVKKVFNAMLFAERKFRRFPKGTEGLFPEGTNIVDVVNAIIKHHPNVSAYFFLGSPVGFALMKTESDIMVKTLLTLKSMGVPALPVHDAVVVPETFAELSQKVMKFTAEEVAKAKIGVSRE